MDRRAMYQLTYGLFVLSAKDGDKDNGCIINTAAQVTTSPNRITIAVNKQNYTHDMIMKTGKFNISILDETTPFFVFERFGFQSGRDVDKLEDYKVLRAENDVIYLKEHASAYISGTVVDTMDLGTHTLFLADVSAGEILSGVNPVTYTYYQNHIKPKPEKTEKKGYRCKVCGYIYEGEPLPEDFICPICKHGAEDFEKIV
ncbi:MAG: flavin reductase [Clostridia bacterium]|nr:flavin reductase [Clostridia bacterium]NCC43226.1 flavin reductase [Clostridia bacterium]